MKAYALWALSAVVLGLVAYTVNALIGLFQDGEQS